MSGANANMTAARVNDSSGLLTGVAGVACNAVIRINYVGASSFLRLLTNEDSSDEANITFVDTAWGGTSDCGRRGSGRFA